MFHTNSIVIFLAFVVCIPSLFCLTHGELVFTVEGNVYCDICRVQLMTKTAKFIQGAKVRLECKNRKSGAVTFTGDAETNKDGEYQIKVYGEHLQKDELCEMIPISSPDPNCNEISRDPSVRKANQITLAELKGMSSNTRTVTSIGFLTKKVPPECSEILKKTSVTAFGLVP